MKTCSKCGKIYQDQDRFCMQCGCPLPEALTPPVTPAAPVTSSAPAEKIQIMDYKDLEPAIVPTHPTVPFVQPQSTSIPNPSPANPQIPNQQVPPVYYQQPVQPVVYCPNCKRPIPPASRICGYCGVNLQLYRPSQPQFQNHYPNNLAMNRPVLSAATQSLSTNVVGIIACLLCLVFLLAPFFKTIRLTTNRGEEIGFSVYELTFDNDSSSSNRETDKYMKENWSSTHEVLSALCGYTGAALYVAAVITYFFVIRLLASKNIFRFWDILQLCSVLAFFATGCFAGVYFVNKDALKTLLRRSNVSMHPTPYFFIAAAVIITVFILAGGMRHRAETDSET